MLTVAFNCLIIKPGGFVSAAAESSWYTCKDDL